MPPEEEEAWEEAIMNVILINGWNNIHKDDPFSLWNVPCDEVMRWIDRTKNIQEQKGGI